MPRQLKAHGHEYHNVSNQLSHTGKEFSDLYTDLGYEPKEKTQTDSKEKSAQSQKKAKMKQIKNTVQKYAKAAAMTIATATTVVTVAVTSEGAVFPELHNIVKQVQENWDKPIIEPQKGISAEQFAQAWEEGAEVVIAEMNGETPENPDQKVLIADGVSGGGGEQAVEAETEPELEMSTEGVLELEEEETTAAEEESSSEEETLPSSEEETSTEESTEAATEASTEASTEESTTQQPTQSSGGGGGGSKPTEPETEPTEPETTAEEPVDLTKCPECGETLTEAEAGTEKICGKLYSTIPQFECETCREFYGVIEGKLEKLDSPESYLEMYHEGSFVFNGDYLICDKCKKSILRLQHMMYLVEGADGEPNTNRLSFEVHVDAPYYVDDILYDITINGEYLEPDEKTGYGYYDTMKWDFVGETPGTNITLEFMLSNTPFGSCDISTTRVYVTE